MTQPTSYEIELRGNLGCRSLRPFMDDFTLAESEAGVTRLVGVITDASQMHGLVVHLASRNIDIISIAPARAPLWSGAAGSSPVDEEGDAESNEQGC